MRIALFCPYLPEPPMTGGRIRIHHFARRVAAEHEVHLFAVAHPRELARPGVRAALDRFASWHVTPAPRSFLPGLRLPARVRDGVAPRPAQAFHALHRARPFDVLWVEHVHAARLAQQAGRPWLLDEHNIESDYYRDKLAARGRTGPWVQREVRRLATWERAMWTSAQRVVCVTDADAQRVDAETGRRPEVIPNGVDLAQVHFRPPSARTGANVLFVGLMNHPPNERAAEFLVRQVMPRVWAERQDARLVLCGANPSREVKRLEGPRVQVTGTVDSVAPYLDDARAYAFPLFHGAGSSLKLVEALAAGIPLVATEVAVRGFPVAPEVHFAPATDGESFARRIIDCLSSDAATEARAAAGREVAEKYGWAALADRVEALLRGLR